MKNLIWLSVVALAVGCGAGRVVDFPDNNGGPVPTGSGGSNAGGSTTTASSAGGAGGSGTASSSGGAGGVETTTTVTVGVGGFGGATVGVGGGETVGVGGANTTSVSSSTGVGGASSSSSGTGGASSSSGTGGAGGCSCNEQCPFGDVCLQGACVNPCDGVECPEGEQCVLGECQCDGEPSDGTCDSGKALLCHVPPGNPAALHDICVGEAAVGAHLNHGDFLGCCDSSTP